MAEKLQKYIPLHKVDLGKHQVSGVIAAEQVDHAREIFDYAGSRPYFEAWSGRYAEVTGGRSLGNVRAMHGPVAAGKLVAIGFDDARKLIEVTAEIVDAAEWAKCEKGVYTGFSIGGAYEDRRPEPSAPGIFRYIANPTEVSLVDAPCIPGAVFTAVKADGSEEIRKFLSPDDGDAPAWADPVQRLFEVANDLQSRIGALESGVTAANAAVAALGTALDGLTRATEEHLDSPADEAHDEDAADDQANDAADDDDDDDEDDDEDDEAPPPWLAGLNATLGTLAGALQSLLHAQAAQKHAPTDAPDPAALTATVADLREQLAKAETAHSGRETDLAGQVAALAERLRTVEQAPAPGGPVLRVDPGAGALAPVEKTLITDQTAPAHPLDAQIATLQERLLHTVDPQIKRGIAAEIAGLRQRRAQEA